MPTESAVAVKTRAWHGRIVDQVVGDPDHSGLPKGASGCVFSVWFVWVTF